MKLPWLRAPGFRKSIFPTQGRFAAPTFALPLGILFSAFAIQFPAIAVSPNFEVLGPDIENLSWTPGVAPHAGEVEIIDVSAPRTGYFSIPGVSQGFDFLYDNLDKLDNNTGLRFGTAYTMLSQGLTSGSWPRYGTAGDFDLFSSWAPIGRNSANTGRFVFDIEERFVIGPRTPNSLGAGVGTLQPTANTFNDRGFVVRDVFYEQRLVEGQLRFMIGRADSTDYFGSTWLQSANNSFVNRMFASNPTIAGPGHGPAVGMSYRPNEHDFYVAGGAANAYNSTTTTGFDSLDQTTFFSYGEIGCTPTLQSLGEGRYSFSGWHIGERTQTGLPSDWGVSAVADQKIHELADVFARYGYSEAGTLGIRHYIQGGAGYRVPLCGTNDFTGVGFSYAIPHSTAARDEKVLEGFYRLQFTRFCQLSLGAQAIFDPANAVPARDVVGAIWGRLRVDF